MKLFVCADDLTGTLDTGVQFTRMGLGIQVCTSRPESGTEEVTAFDTESRQSSPGEAYEKVFHAFRAAGQAGAGLFYKKTDSALRGNIGAELSAAMDALGRDTMCFIPAFPRMGRTTEGGKCLVNGTELQKSIFGSDPLDPATTAEISAILQRTAGLNTVTVPSAKDWPSLRGKAGPGKTVFVFDARTDEDLRGIADALALTGDTTLLAGCAGFAAQYERILGAVPAEAEQESPLPKTGGLIVICGSVNPVTGQQLDRAEQAGFARIRLPEELKRCGDPTEFPGWRAFLDALFSKADHEKHLIVESLGPVPGQAPEQTAAYVRLILGALGRELISRFPGRTFCLTGGDTLMSVLDGWEGSSLSPIREFGKGAVVVRMHCPAGTISAVTKSGGFGESDLLIRLAEACT